MALKLTIVSDQRASLGREAAIVLGVGGGSIGRAHDNDWVLPDPECYLSAHHARIQFRHGCYYLLDTSTNGVYVNGGTVPIGRRNAYPLRDGDALRLGQFELAVNIDAEDTAKAASGELDVTAAPQAADRHGAAAPYAAVAPYVVAADASALTAAALAPEASSIFPLNAQVTAAAEAALTPDIGAAIDVQQLLTTALVRHGSGSYHGPVDAFGQAVSVVVDTGLLAFGRPRTRVAADATARVGTGAGMDTDTTAATHANRSERPAPVRPRAHSSTITFAAGATVAAAPPAAAAAGMPSATGIGTAAAATGVSGAAIEALCRGAGLDPRRLPPDAQPRVLYLAGLLLREALVGLKGLTLAQRELRDQTRIDVGRESTQQIALTGLPVEDLLLRLLVGNERHELDAVQWLRDTAANVRSHDVAMMRALTEALTEFVARLDPAALSQGDAPPPATVGDTASTGVTARFRAITEASSGSLPQLFTEAFARAFAAEYRRGRGDHSGS